MLTILIPTITERKKQLDKLTAELWRQITTSGAEDIVSIVVCSDDKQATIGAKRQFMLDNCDTEYCVFVDDDDWISSDFILEFMQASLNNPDCITYAESIHKDGKQIQTAVHSNDLAYWTGLITFEGQTYTFGRTPFYKDIIRTSIAKRIGFKDLRYGEDSDFAARLKKSKLIQTEVHLDKVMYIYNAPDDMDRETHNKRYGIQ